MEFGEVASDNVVRLIGQSVGVAFCLFKGRKKFAVGLPSDFI